MFAYFIGAAPDGSRVLFATDAALDPADHNTDYDVYAITTGGPSLVSTGAPGDSTFPSPIFVSADASAFVFYSTARLVPEDLDDENDLYMSKGGSFRLVADGAYQLSWSQFVGNRFYVSTSQPIDPADTDTRLDVYDATDAAARLTTPFDGGYDIQFYQYSVDGHYGFLGASRLTPDDHDNVTDVYRFDLIDPGAPVLVSAGATLAGDWGTTFAGASDDGQFVALGSNDRLTADDTEPANTVNSADVYLSRIVPVPRRPWQPEASFRAGMSPRPPTRSSRP